jgi:hypothetical protein
MSDGPGARTPGSRLLLTTSWALLVVGFAYLVLIGGSYEASSRVGVQVVAQVVVVATLVGWLVAAVRNPWWRPRSSLLVPGGIALAAMLVCALLAADLRISFGGLVVATLGLAGLLFVERLATHPFFRPRLRVLVAAVPVGLAVLYVGQVLAGWTSWWGLVGQLVVPPLRPDSAGLTLGSPNLVATVLLLLAPLGMAVSLTGDGQARRRRAAAIAIGGLALVAIALTGSRGGALGLAGVVVAGVLLAALGSDRVSRRSLIIGGLVILAMCASLVVVLAARGSQGGEDFRLELWRTAVAIFVADPLTGGGPGSWALLKLAQAQPFVPTVALHHAHNVYLWTLAELGIVGSVGVLVFAVAIIRLLVRRLRSGDRDAATLAIAALAAMTGLALQSLVDVVTNLPAILLVIAVVVGYAVAQVPSDVDRPGSPRVPSGADGSGARRRRLGAAVAAVLAIGLLVVGFTRTDLALEAAQGARAALLAGDFGLAVDGFTKAGDLDPLRLYRDELALAAAYAGELATASRLTDGTVELDGLAHHLIFQAYLRLASGDAAGAVASARLAMDRGWADPGVMLNASAIGERAGDASLAEDGLVLAAALAPTSLEDPYWRAPGRSLPYDELVARAAAAALDHGGRAQAVLVLGFGGDAAGARRALQGMEGVASVDRARLAAIVASRTDLGGAIATLQQMLTANPQDWSTAAWLSRLQSEAGDPEAANRNARYAAIVQGDSASGVLDLPRHVAGDRGLPQFRLYGYYPASIYFQNGSGLLFGPGSVSLVP